MHDGKTGEPSVKDELLQRYVRFQNWADELRAIAAEMQSKGDDPYSVVRLADEYGKYATELISILRLWTTHAESASSSVPAFSVNREGSPAQN